jgi:hypothetical protein
MMDEIESMDQINPTNAIGRMWGILGGYNLPIVRYIRSTFLDWFHKNFWIMTKCSCTFAQVSGLSKFLCSLCHPSRTTHDRNSLDKPQNIDENNSSTLSPRTLNDFLDPEMIVANYQAGSHQQLIPPHSFGTGHLLHSEILKVDMMTIR